MGIKHWLKLTYTVALLVAGWALLYDVDHHRGEPFALAVVALAITGQLLVVLLYLCNDKGD